MALRAHARTTIQRNNPRPSGDDTTDVTRPFRLWDLPQELRDLIFTFEYPEQTGLRIIFKRHFDKEQVDHRKRIGASYSPLEFPSLKVDEWLVSKRYFLAAARAWMDAQSFAYTNPLDRLYHSLTSTANFIMYHHGLYEELSLIHI